MPNPADLPSLLSFTPSGGGAAATLLDILADTTLGPTAVPHFTGGPGPQLRDIVQLQQSSSPAILSASMEFLVTFTFFSLAFSV